MPFDRITPFGTHRGLVSDEDRMNQAAQQAAIQQQAAQAELAARLGIAQMGNQTQRYGIDRQLEGTGTFNQRSAHEGSMFDRGAQLTRDMDKSATDRAFGTIDRQMMPAMGRESREKAIFDAETPLREARQNMQLGAMNALKMGFGGQSGAGGQATAPTGDQFDLLSLQAAIAAGGAIPDISGRAQQRELSNLQMSELKRSIEKARAQEALRGGDPEGARKLAQASGVSLEIDPIEEFVGKNQGLTETLSAGTKKFADRDIAMTGWDPTQQDISQILSERNRLQQALVKRGYLPEDALREANRIISTNLGEDQNDVNAGWISELRKQAGL